MILEEIRGRDSALAANASFHLAAARLALGETVAASILLERTAEEPLAVGRRAEEALSALLRADGRHRDAVALCDAVAARCRRERDHESEGRWALSAARALEASGDAVGAARRYLAVARSRAVAPVAHEAAVALRGAYGRGVSGLPERTVALDLEMARIAEGAGDFAEAVETYEEILARPGRGDRADLLLRIGRAEYRGARYRSALETLRRLRREFPSFQPAVVEYETAKCLDRLGRGREAEAAFRAVYARPDAETYRDDALWELAVHREEAGDTAAATAHYRLLARIRRSPFAAGAAWRLGFGLLASGDVAGARVAFDDAHRAYPRSEHSAATAFWRARCLEIEGRADEALEAYAECAAGDVPAYYRALSEEAVERLRAEGRGPAEEDGERELSALRGGLAAGDSAAIAAARRLLYRFSGTPLAARVRREARRALAASPAWKEAAVDVAHPAALLAYATTRRPEALRRLSVASALVEAGAADEAADEIRAASAALGDRPLVRLAAASVLLEGGEHRAAVREAESVLSALPAADPSLLPEPIARLLFPRPFVAEIEAAARRFGVEEELVLAVVREESRFQADAVSRAGARGLMQIMPGTGREIARRLGERGFRVDDLVRPEVNVGFGAHYLRSLLDRFGRADLALAAYNAGPGNAGRWLRLQRGLEAPALVERIDFGETRRYVKRVLGTRWTYRRLAES